MSKPIFCATHPRACSTAFERVFMTRKDLACVHEPFGDAFYFGPERMSVRYQNDESARASSGFSKSTYGSIFDRFEREASEGKRLFIKDIAHYLVPPDQKTPQIAPSLHPKRRGIGTDNGVRNTTHQASNPPTSDGEPGNPTVVPQELLEKFHFTFLIRDPHRSIPSYYRCTIPPLSNLTGFHDFYPSEAGYDELRRFFDYTRSAGIIGDQLAGNHDDQTNGLTNGVVTNGHGVNGLATNGHNVNGITTNGHTTNGDHTNGDHANGDYSNGDHVNGGHANGVMTAHGTSNEIKPRVDTCVIEADDLLDDPEGILRPYCESVGLDYTPDMLNWDSEDEHQKAKAAFEKWKGFHEDAIDSKDLKPRAHKKAQKTEEEWDAEWQAKYGAEGAKLIRGTVDACMADYLYMKQFALKA